MQILNYGTNPSAAIDILKQRLITELSNGNRVLWFLSGGSSIKISVQVMQQINDEQSKNLTLALGDERYGSLGHANSNWQQLLEAGFEPKSAKTVNVLQGNLHDMVLAAEQYNTVLHDLLSENDIVIGQYGMGADGHIAGILPGSPAVMATSLAAAYQGPDFERITTTFETIKQCSVAFLFVEGDKKRSVLESLQRDVSLSDQPAQILKQIPEAYVFNDQIGDSM